MNKFKVGDKLFVLPPGIHVSIDDEYWDIIDNSKIEVINILKRIIDGKVRWIYICVYINNDKVFEVFNDWHLYRNEKGWIEAIIKTKKIDVQDYKRWIKEMKEDLIEWENRLEDYGDKNEK